MLTTFSRRGRPLGCRSMRNVQPDLAVVLSAWQFGDPVHVAAPERGTNNWVRVVDLRDRRVVVRLYQNLDEDRVAGEHAMLAFLADRQLPFAVPTPVPTDDGRTWVTTPYGPAAVFAWIEGVRPEPVPDALTRIGTALGHLDVALAATPDTLVPYDWRRDLAATHPGAGDLATMCRELAGEGYDELLAELPAIDAACAALRDEVPVQVIHQDMGLSNVIMRGGEVAALLDFELVGIDLRVKDATGALTQTGCLDTDDVERATTFLRGYDEVVGLTETEITAIPSLLRFRAASALVWRYGRYRRGQSTRNDVIERLVAFGQTEAWLRRHGAALVASCLRPGRR
ncbi:MAG: phosphotransferase [Streptosporangiales bacterium]|nr:phosphotransferase [Streptosporangiales bacterium]